MKELTLVWRSRARLVSGPATVCSFPASSPSQARCLLPTACPMSPRSADCVSLLTRLSSQAPGFQILPAPGPSNQPAAGRTPTPCAAVCQGLPHAWFRWTLKAMGDWGARDPQTRTRSCCPYPCLGLCKGSPATCPSFEQTFCVGEKPGVIFLATIWSWEKKTQITFGPKTERRASPSTLLMEPSALILPWSQCYSPPLSRGVGGVTLLSQWKGWVGTLLPI